MKTIKVLLFITLSVYLITLVGCYKASMGHECRFIHCPFKGAGAGYQDRCSCAKGSGCYEADSVHMLHPNDDL